MVAGFVLSRVHPSVSLWLLAPPLAVAAVALRGMQVPAPSPWPSTGCAATIRPASRG